MEALNDEEGTDLGRCFDDLADRRLCSGYQHKQLIQHPS